MSDLRSKLSGRVQLTTDGLRLYVTAIEDAFGSPVDYAQLVKLDDHNYAREERRYSPS